MFIKIILSYLLGYLRISVEGYYIERFINICKNNKITIWNLKRNKDIQLYLNVRIGEFKQICKIAKKTKAHGDAVFSTRKNKNKRTKEIEKQASKRARRLVKMQLRTININNPEYDNIYRTFEMYEKQATPSHMLG